MSRSLGPEVAVAISAIPTRVCVFGRGLERGTDLTGFSGQTED